MERHRHIVGALCAGLSLLALCTAPRAGDVAIEAAVDDYFRPLLQEDLISGSILIARGDRILLAKGYGPANREHGIPNGPETRFRIGSMTKQFTAAAVLLLAQRGQLACEDSLARFLPDYPRAGDITLHQLMTHTAGVPSYVALDGYDEKMLLPWGIDEVIAFFKDQPLLFEPGQGFAYSNSGYVLLAKVIETVSGRPYGAFLREEIFAPLGMDATGVDEFTSVLPHRATGHGNAGDGDGVYQAPYRDMPWTSGAGSLCSTVLDLYRWDRALNTDALLTASWREKMFTPVEHGYACGWFVREELGHRVCEHGGAINGFLAQIQRFVDDDVVVISLFNYETIFWRPANRALAAIALGLPHDPALRDEPLALPPETLARYAGRYELAPDHVVTLRVDAGRLLVETSDRPAAEALAQTETKFFVRDHVVLLQVQLDEAGRATGILAQQGANTFRGRRVE